MKLYAKQVPPEHQESPLFHAGSWPEKVFVFGNSHFNQHDEYLQTVRQGLEEAADEWDTLQMGNSWYNGWIDILNELLPPDASRGEYTRAERLELAKLAAQYEWPGSRNMENKILCRVLELITGQEWTAGTIRGCCQSDWQEIIYPAEYGREWLAAFEAEYFNTGSEWHIKESDEDPGYYQYCTGWNNAMIRAEIAEVAGCEPCDVVLLKFTGWSRTASYEEVTA